MQTHLYGAKLYGIHPWQDYIFSVRQEGRPEIVHISSTDTSPIFVAIAESNQGEVYSFLIQNAVRSNRLLDALSKADRTHLQQLAALTPPKPDYSRWRWVSE